MDTHTHVRTTIPRNVFFFLRVQCERLDRIYKHTICFHKQVRPVSQLRLTPVTQCCSEPPAALALVLEPSRPDWSEKSRTAECSRCSEAGPRSWRQLTDRKTSPKQCNLEWRTQTLRQMTPGVAPEVSRSSVRTKILFLFLFLMEQSRRTERRCHVSGFSLQMVGHREL